MEGREGDSHEEGGTMLEDAVKHMVRAWKPQRFKQGQCALLAHESGHTSTQHTMHLSRVRNRVVSWIDTQVRSVRGMPRDAPAVSHEFNNQTKV